MTLDAALNALVYSIATVIAVLVAMLIVDVKGVLLAYLKAPTASATLKFATDIAANALAAFIQEGKLAKAEVVAEDGFDSILDSVTKSLAARGLTLEDTELKALVHTTIYYLGGTLNTLATGTAPLKLLPPAAPPPAP